MILLICIAGMCGDFKAANLVKVVYLRNAYENRMEFQIPHESQNSNSQRSGMYVHWCYSCSIWIYTRQYAI